MTKNGTESNQDTEGSSANAWKRGAGQSEVAGFHPSRFSSRKTSMRQQLGSRGSVIRGRAGALSTNRTHPMCSEARMENLLVFSMIFRQLDSSTRSMRAGSSIL